MTRPADASATAWPDPMALFPLQLVLFPGARLGLKVFEARRAELEKAQAAALEQAKGRGARLDGLVLKITQKAGVDGKLFGSVTNHDLVDALKAQGHEVERAQIRMPTGALKQAGEYPIQVALHTDVVVTITVSVIGET